MCCTWYRKEEEIPKREGVRRESFCWKQVRYQFVAGSLAFRTSRQNIYRKKKKNKLSGIAFWANVESLSSGLHFKLVLVAQKLAKIWWKVSWAEVSTRRLLTLFRHSIKTIAERNCSSWTERQASLESTQQKTDIAKKYELLESVFSSTVIQLFLVKSEELTDTSAVHPEVGRDSSCDVVPRMRTKIMIFRKIYSSHYIIFRVFFCRRWS